MEREAAPRQGIERAAGAPIERQKAARLAGSRASDLRSLDDGDFHAAPRQEIGGAGSDHAAAGDQDTHFSSHHPVTYSVRPPARPLTRGEWRSAAEVCALHLRRFAQGLPTLLETPPHPRAGGEVLLAALLARGFAGRLLRLVDVFAAVTFQLRLDVVGDPLLVPPLDRQDGDAVQVDAVVEVIAG